MQINTLMRFSNNGYNLADIGLKLALVPTKSARTEQTSQYIEQKKNSESDVERKVSQYTLEEDTLSLSAAAQEQFKAMAWTYEMEKQKPLIHTDPDEDEETPEDEVPAGDEEPTEPEATVVSERSAGVSANQPVDTTSEVQPLFKAVIDAYINLVPQAAINVIA